MKQFLGVQYNKAVAREHTTMLCALKEMGVKKEKDDSYWLYNGCKMIGDDKKVRDILLLRVVIFSNRR